MTTTPPRLGLRRVPASLLVITFAVGACAKATKSEEADPQEANPPPTMLRVDLSAGVQVTLDGEPIGTTPFDAITVQPGSRALVLGNECHQHEAPLEIPADRTEALRRWLARPGAMPADLLAMATRFPKAEPSLLYALRILS
jgi:hypothetical protein